MVQKLELFPTTYEYSIGKYDNLKEMFVRGDVDISGNIAMSGNINCNEINSTSITATTFYGDGSQLTGIITSGGSANLNEHSDVSFGNVDISGTINITGTATISINDVNDQNITLLEMKTHSNTPRIKHDFWQNSTGYGDYQIYPASAATTDFKIGGFNSTFQTIRLNALNGVEVYSNQSTNTFGNIKCNNIISNLVGDVTGSVSSLTNHDTDNLSEGSTNKYYSNSLVDSYLSGGTGITYSNGSISISSIPYYTASKQTNSQHSPNTGHIPVTGFHNYACNPVYPDVFNPGNGEFTAPISGMYMVNYSCNIHDGTSPYLQGVGSVLEMDTGSGFFSYKYNYTSFTSSTIHNQRNASMDGLFYIQQGDKIRHAIDVYSSGGTSNLYDMRGDNTLPRLTYQSVILMVRT